MGLTGSTRLTHRRLAAGVVLSVLVAGVIALPAQAQSTKSNRSLDAADPGGKQSAAPRSTFSAAPKQRKPTGAFGRNAARTPSAAGKPVTKISQEAKAYGAFQRSYYLTAMNLALPAAEKGSATAQTLVAELFARGLGVARSMDDAAFWYGQAAKNGDPAAQFSYGLMLMHGQVVKKDEARGQAFMKKAADAGIPAAAFNHGQWLVSQKPGGAGLKAALPYYREAADAGIADAQYALSQIYRNSPDIPDAERKKARYWLERAAEAGYDTAELDLGIWLIDGIEGKVDYGKGFKWMKRAAEGGNVMAENRLAHLYRSGIGTGQDRIAAATWYVLARRAGLQDAKLSDFFQGLDEDQQKQAIKRANALQKR